MKINSNSQDASQASSSAMSWCDQHPWLFVMLAFLLLLGAWSSMIVIAVKHAPARIDPISQPRHQ